MMIYSSPSLLLAHGKIRGGPRKFQYSAGALADPGVKVDTPPTQETSTAYLAQLEIIPDDQMSILQEKFRTNIIQMWSRVPDK